MPSERQMWEVLQPQMKRLKMDPVRVENPALPGTPDVNFIEGWVELKHTDSWPVQGGQLRLNHPPTPQQIVWLTRRWELGGNCWLALRVDKDWFLIRGNKVHSLWGGNRHPRKVDLIAACELWTIYSIEIAERLKRGRDDD